MADKFYNGYSMDSIHTYEMLDRLRHRITLTEDQRQLMLLALAELSIARPGFTDCLAEIAKLMDNPTDDGGTGAQMFDQFRRNHSNALAEKLRGDDQKVCVNCRKLSPCSALACHWCGGRFMA